VENHLRLNPLPSKNRCEVPAVQALHTDLIEQQFQRSWLIGLSQTQWAQRTQEILATVHSLQQEIPVPRILLLCADPLEFLAGFTAAILTQAPVFLGNSQWGEQERARAIALIHPHVIIADDCFEHLERAAIEPENPAQPGWIMIPTGGTSGTVRFAIHTWETLAASVEGMVQFFFPNSPHPIHSWCLLPLCHVSGLMQVFRAWLTEGQLVITPFAAVLKGDRPLPNLADIQAADSWFLSLVPTQLYRLVKQDHHQSWLRQFATILLGGAPASLELLQQSRTMGLRLAPTYGMTETASQVVTLHPDDFLTGQIHGRVLPHAHIELAVGGRLQIQATSLFRGYYPAAQVQKTFISDDLGRFYPDQSLQILGRYNRVIQSGGEIIFPEEVEGVLMALPGIVDVCVVGLPDPEWGERVSAVYVPTAELIDPVGVGRSLRGQLATYKWPKRWIPLPELPRNAQGKLNFPELMQQIQLMS
jgi:o-succinylbenzoate---CoA ligase